MHDIFIIYSLGSPLMFVSLTLTWAETPQGATVGTNCQKPSGPVLPFFLTQVAIWWFSWVLHLVCKMPLSRERIHSTFDLNYNRGIFYFCLFILVLAEQMYQLLDIL